tara:strand:+ start:1216 stop:1827 length:612 start_codon:yes stop_codon:yes gene_type:complete
MYNKDFKDLCNSWNNFINEQNSTKCLTSGANFSTYISEREVDIKVDLPFSLDLDEKEAKILETLLHNSIETVLRPYFYKKDENIFKDRDNEKIVDRNPDIRDIISQAKSKDKKVIGFDYHNTLVNVIDRESVLPREKMIKKLKDYYEKGAHIIIYTAAPEEDRDIILSQLSELNIPFDNLVTEKPRLDKMYDDRYIGPDDDWV